MAQLSLWDELQWRGFFFQCTNERDLRSYLEDDKRVIYAGFDPTGKSLHIGHFVPLLLLSHFGKHGHTPIVLTGGGTAKIGDPSGKTSSRPLLSAEDLADNSHALFTQAQNVMATLGCPHAQMRNNAQWLDELSFIDFIRDIGSHFSVSRMLSFDAYKNRLEGGLTFLEFTYQLLQAYDFLHLHDKHGCTIQAGGADQWANIVAGCDLIRRVRQKEVFGYTVPLITRADGAKMGKSEKGAVFFDPSLTPPFDFYQYWRNVSDADAYRFLKMYTILPKEEIERFEKASGEALNEAKELLAYTVTEMVHGREAAQSMQQAARAAFGGRDSDDAAQPRFAVPRAKVAAGLTFADLYVDSGLASSKSEARRLIAQGGARIGDALITDENEQLQEHHFAHGNPLLRSGKKKFVRLMLEE